jgi:murein DD-endopeptidase MepM/ murein hydrolase activator NlpD
MINSNQLKLNNFIFLFTLFLVLGWLTSEAGETKKVSNANINSDPNFKIAQAIVISGYPIQGNLIIAKTNPSNKVQLNDASIEIDESGVFVIGFNRDERKKSILTITNKNKKTFKTILKPIQREYNIQRIDGLKQSMVTPPQEVIDRIKNDRKMVNEARNIRWIKKGDFVRGFDWPLKGPISGVYGSQRILNGIPKSPHFGIDISVPKGTPVLAPAGGIISLADNLYYSGYTVILNHGLKVNSTFLHLDEIKVEVGDKVNRGDLIGFSGNSGRSTGPHLDWRIDWNGRRLDAAMLAGPMG